MYCRSERTPQNTFSLVSRNYKCSHRNEVLSFFWVEPSFLTSFDEIWQERWQIIWLKYRVGEFLCFNFSKVLSIFVKRMNVLSILISCMFKNPASHQNDYSPARCWSFSSCPFPTRTELDLWIDSTYGNRSLCSD